MGFASTLEVLLEIIEPPGKPAQIIAEGEIFSKHRNHPNETFRTRIWIGKPYQEGDKWICEEYVEGFSQGKAPGGSSLEALCGAICVARIDIEGLIALGYELVIPDDPTVIGSEKVFRKVFSLYFAWLFRDDTDKPGTKAENN